MFRSGEYSCGRFTSLSRTRYSTEQIRDTVQDEDEFDPPLPTFNHIGPDSTTSPYDRRHEYPTTTWPY